LIPSSRLALFFQILVASMNPERARFTEEEVDVIARSSSRIAPTLGPGTLFLNYLERMIRW
jgi:hypothetical protein